MCIRLSVVMLLIPDKRHVHKAYWSQICVSVRGWYLLTNNTVRHLSISQEYNEKIPYFAMTCWQSKLYLNHIHTVTIILTFTAIWVSILLNTSASNCRSQLLLKPCEQCVILEWDLVDYQSQLIHKGQSPYQKVMTSSCLKDLMICPECWNSLHSNPLRKYWQSCYNNSYVSPERRR